MGKLNSKNEIELLKQLANLLYLVSTCLEVYSYSFFNWSKLPIQPCSYQDLQSKVFACGYGCWTKSLKEDKS